MDLKYYGKSGHAFRFREKGLGLHFHTVGHLFGAFLSILRNFSCDMGFHKLVNMHLLNIGLVFKGENILQLLCARCENIWFEGSLMKALVLFFCSHVKKVK